MRGAPKAGTVDEYLSRLPPKQRAALEKLRAQIHAAAPKAEEVISYGQPTFKQHGHLVAFGAFRNHLSFFPMNSKVIAAHAAGLKGFETSKGTIQFTPEKPVPATIIRKIVKARIAQNLEIEGERKRKKTKARSPQKKT